MTYTHNPSSGEAEIGGLLSFPVYLGYKSLQSLHSGRRAVGGKEPLERLRSPQPSATELPGYDSQHRGKDSEESLAPHSSSCHSNSKRRGGKGTVSFALLPLVHFCHSCGCSLSSLSGGAGTPSQILWLPALVFEVSQRGSEDILLAFPWRHELLAWHCAKACLPFLTLPWLSGWFSWLCVPPPSDEPCTGEPWDPGSDLTPGWCVSQFLHWRRTCGITANTDNSGEGALSKPQGRLAPCDLEESQMISPGSFLSSFSARYSALLLGQAERQLNLDFFLITSEME
ncbi:uncharacterized protein LOC101789185 [Cavia porcellus]|uniref:uncharacterized protein LOC101789185 n=1 Tax=Cavia porcellus TaxID=10141 RepID=UPI000661DB86